MTENRAHPLLSAERLSRLAEDGTLLLDDVSLSLTSGESVALVGPPGAGKTLLLRALALLDPLDDGQVRLRGNPISDESVPGFRSQVMYVQQQPPLIEGTVRDNLMLPFTFRSRTTKSFDGEQIKIWLNALGRQPAFLERSSADLSGGESQIVALLRALQLNPAVLLLDEPTSSLDQQTSSQVESLLRHWRQEDDRRAMLIITHDDSQAERMADRIVRIERGRIVDEGGHL